VSARRAATGATAAAAAEREEAEEHGECRGWRGRVDDVRRGILIIILGREVPAKAS